MNFIDKRIVDLLVDNYADVRKVVKERQDVTKEFYELQFAVLNTPAHKR
jgi:hypothetical protein